jgi:hypothetical protein
LFCNRQHTAPGLYRGLAVCAENNLRIEHGDKRVKVAFVGGRNECIDDLALSR